MGVRCIGLLTTVIASTLHAQSHPMQVVMSQPCGKAAAEQAFRRGIQRMGEAASREHWMEGLQSVQGAANLDGACLPVQLTLAYACRQRLKPAVQCDAGSHAARALDLAGNHGVALNAVLLSPFMEFSVHQKAASRLKALGLLEAREPSLVARELLRQQRLLEALPYVLESMERTAPGVQDLELVRHYARALLAQGLVDDAAHFYAWLWQRNTSPRSRTCRQFQPAISALANHPAVADMVREVGLECAGWDHALNARELAALGRQEEAEHEQILALLQNPLLVDVLQPMNARLVEQGRVQESMEWEARYLDVEQDANELCSHWQGLGSDVRTAWRRVNPAFSYLVEQRLLLLGCPVGLINPSMVGRLEPGWYRKAVAMLPTQTGATMLSGNMPLP